MLDASTAHLPPALRNDLNGEEGVVAHRIEDGWLLWVPDDPDDRYDPPPEVVLNLQRYARARGCDYVLLDCDGPVHGGLPTWDEESNSEPTPTHQPKGETRE